jgi:hypothetical protein
MHEQLNMSTTFGLQNLTNTNLKFKIKVTLKMVTTIKSTNNMCIKGKREGRENNNNIEE